MYQNTPTSARNSRTDQPPNPTHAPRMAPCSLPFPAHAPGFSPNPHTSGGYAPYAMPQYAGRPPVAYGLMTPPDSPEKASSGGRAGPDFHPMVDVRGPPLAFDVRQGIHLSGAAAAQPALNHSASRLVVNVGPGVFAVEIAPSAGGVVTLSDFYGQLAHALKMRASPTEVSNAVQHGFLAPTQVSASTSRAVLLHNKVMFAGLSLRCVQQGVAYVDCHLR